MLRAFAPSTRTWYGCGSCSPTGGTSTPTSPLRLAPPGTPPLLLGSWGARAEQAARDFDGWLASGYRSTAGQIIAAHDRYRSPGGRRAIVCAIPVKARDDLGPVGEQLQRFRQLSHQDHFTRLFERGEPDPAAVALEELIEGSRWSILLLDPATATLHHGAAPSLPAACSAEIDGLLVGPQAGSCGAAACC